MTDTGMVAPFRRVDMWYDGPGPQRRLTVAFRIVLVIPQFIVLYFLALAMIIVLIIGWFGALFMGRLPGWVHSFVSGVVRWYTRVGAYMLLLTDRYPPFSLDDEAYPARPILPEPGRLNRWAVLFRLILVLPAAVFYQIVSYGLTIPLLFVAWLIVLIGGRLPRPLHGAYSALLRYAVRLDAYITMLTPEYSWGMLGDRSAAAPAPPFPPSVAGIAAQPFTTASGSGGPSSTGAPAYAPRSTPPAPQPYSYGSAPSTSVPTPETETETETEPETEPETAPQPEPEVAGTADGAPPSDTEQPGAAQSDVPAAPAWPPPPPPPLVPPPPTDLGAMPPPSPWERTVALPGSATEQSGWGTLVLKGAARGWMIFAIVWGSLLFVGQAVAQGVRTNRTAATVRQYNTIVSDYNGTYNVLRTTLVKGGTGPDACTTLTWLQTADQQTADSLGRFGAALHDMSFPSDADDSSQRVESDVAQLSVFFQALASAPNLGQYRTLARQSNVSALLSSYPTDVQSLLNDVNARIGR